MTLGLDKSRSYFLREATGLLREWNTKDAFMYLVLQAAVPMYVSLVYAQGAWLFGGGSLALAAIISGIGGTFVGLVYVMLMSMMPRSGGDYVFDSRVLHPALGMMFAGGWAVCWQIIWNLITPGFIASAILAPWFSTLGMIYQSQTLMSLGSWFSTTTAIVAVMIPLFLVNMLMHLAGLKGYAKFQYFLFGFMCISFGLTFLLPLAMGPLGWQSRFDSLVYGLTGTKNAYNTTIGAATGYGFQSSAGFSLTATLVLMPFIFSSIAGNTWIAENAGEIKGANSLKANAKAILGAVWFCAFIIIATSLAFNYAMGQNFLASLGYLFFQGKPEYVLSQPPYTYFLASLMTTSPIIISLIFIGLVANSLNITYNTTLAGSRNLMAMSFDRVFFEKAGHVSDRLHMPTYSILSMYIIAFLLLPIYLFTGFGTILLGAAAAWMVLLVGASLSALVMPWKRPDIYRASPVSKYTIGGIPAMSVVALLAIIFCTSVGVYTLATPTYGLVNLPSYTFVAVTFLMWIPIYYIFRWYRNKQGIDVDLCFATIPPE